jgi:hypothetical protein
LERKGSFHIEVIDAFYLIGKWVLLLAEISITFDDVCKYSVASLGWMSEFRSSRNSDIEILGVDNDVLNGPLFAIL